MYLLSKLYRRKKDFDKEKTMRNVNFYGKRKLLYLCAELT